MPTNFTRLLTGALALALLAAVPAAATVFTYDLATTPNASLATPGPSFSVDCAPQSEFANPDPVLARVDQAIRDYVVASVKGGSSGVDRAMTTFGTEYTAATAKSGNLEKKNATDAALAKLNKAVTDNLAGWKNKIREKATAAWTANRGSSRVSLTVTITDPAKFAIADRTQLPETPTGEQMPSLSPGEYLVDELDYNCNVLPDMMRLPARIERPVGLIHVNVQFLNPDDSEALVSSYFLEAFVDETEAYLQTWREKMNKWRTKFPAWETKLNAASRILNPEEANAKVNDVMTELNDLYNDFAEEVSDKLPAKLQDLWTRSADALSKSKGIKIAVQVELDGTYIPPKLTGWRWVFQVNTPRKEALDRYERFSYRICGSTTTDGNMLTTYTRIRILPDTAQFIDKPEPYLDFNYDLPVAMDANSQLYLRHEVIGEFFAAKRNIIEAKLETANDAIGALLEDDQRETKKTQIIDNFNAEYAAFRDSCQEGLADAINRYVIYWKQMKKDNRNYQIVVGLKTAKNVASIGYSIAKLVLTGGTEVSQYIKIANAVIEMVDTLRKRFDEITKSKARLRNALNVLDEKLGAIDSTLATSNFFEKSDVIAAIDELEGALREFNMKVYALNNDINQLIATLMQLLDVQDGRKGPPKDKKGNPLPMTEIYAQTQAIIDKCETMNVELVQHLTLGREALEMIRNTQLNMGNQHDGVVLTFLKAKIASIKAEDILLAAYKAILPDVAGEIVTMGQNLKRIAEDVAVTAE